MTNDSRRAPEQADVRAPRRTVDPIKVDMQKVTLVGTALWTIALVVLLAVPSLRSGERSWWPWAAVAGVVLGLVGWAYLRRGKGNASAA